MSLILPIMINERTIGSLVISRTQTLRKGDQNYLYGWELIVRNKQDLHGITRPDLQSGTVVHDYDAGAVALIKKVMEAIR